MNGGRGGPWLVYSSSYFISYMKILTVGHIGFREDIGLSKVDTGFV